jgi:hypothetical protein
MAPNVVRQQFKSVCGGPPDRSTVCWSAHGIASAHTVHASTTSVTCWTVLMRNMVVLHKRCRLQIQQDDRKTNKRHRLRALAEDSPIGPRPVPSWYGNSEHNALNTPP